MIYLSSSSKVILTHYLVSKIYRINNKMPPNYCRRRRAKPSHSFTHRIRMFPHWTRDLCLSIQNGTSNWRFWPWYSSAIQYVWESLSNCTTKGAAECIDSRLFVLILIQTRESPFQSIPMIVGLDVFFFDLEIAIVQSWLVDSSRSLMINLTFQEFIDGVDCNCLMAKSWEVSSLKRAEEKAIHGIQGM
jgi:hypothetical protein